MRSKCSLRYTGSDGTLGLGFFYPTHHFQLKVKPGKLNPPRTLDQ